MGEIPSTSDNAGLIAWSVGLRQAPPAISAVAKHFRAIAKEAEDEQPAARAIIEELRAAAVRLEAAASRSEPWYRTVRSQNAEDFDAYENPRHGSVHRESRADVERTFNE